MGDIPLTKVCSKCGIEKPLESFSKNKTSKFGRRPECKQCIKDKVVAVTFVESKSCAHCCVEKHRSCFNLNKKSSDGLQSWCKDCQRERREEPQNKADFALYKRLWRASRTEEQKQKERDTYAVYYEENKDKIVAKSVRINRQQYQSNPQAKLRRLLGSRIKRIIKGTTKTGSAIRDLGCSPAELVKYLESKFQPGMNWDNHGVGRNNETWHIDHIVPLSAFDLTDREQFLRACNFTNLQPLWGSDNIRKGGFKKAA